MFLSEIFFIDMHFKHFIKFKAWLKPCKDNLMVLVHAFYHHYNDVGDFLHPPQKKFGRLHNRK